MGFVQTEDSLHGNRVPGVLPRPRMPKGVVLLAVVCLLMAGAFVLLGSLFAVAPAALRSAGVRQNPDVSARLWILGLFGGVGVVTGAVGYGLWRLERWAYLVVMLSALHPLVRGVIDVLLRGSGLSAPNARLNVRFVVLAIAMLGYLWTPGVRAAFGVQRRSPGGLEQPGT
jgi:hypothetical protein